MKIRNDFVAIKNGKQEIKIHNLILDSYIKNIIEYQFKIDITGNLNMKCVFLKFDTELDFNESTYLNKNDFDLALEILYNFDSPRVETSNKEIINNYEYNFIEGEVAFDIKKDTAISSFKEYDGKKITAIGFSCYKDGDIYACVDTKNYSIYYDATQVLSIIRRDILSTDAYFYSNGKIKEPIHLCAYRQVIENNISNRYSAVIKSIGLGHNPFTMAEERTLLPYDEHIQVNENTIIINDEFTIEKESEGLFPNEDLYPSLELYPARIITNDLYPSTVIYPSVDIYPVHSAYKYIQLKYEVYKSQDMGEYKDTGEYYLLSTPIGNKEQIKLNILYERA